jgi:hypothetical protein
MQRKSQKTEKLPTSGLFQKIKECIESGTYLFTKHAIDRREEREVTIPDVLYVLKNGVPEKRKDTWDELYKTWKYAIKGNTVDKDPLRIIVSFAESGMLIITVIRID